MERYQTEPCALAECLTVSPNLKDCENYGECSKTCGGGEKTCERVCENGTFGDAACPESERVKTMPCNESLCPVLEDCENYGECSKTCGRGEQSCERTCKNSVFGEGGCPESQKIKTVACNEIECRK